MKTRIPTCIEILACTWMGSALGDGTETLGTPSIAIETGTGVVAAGVGLFGFASGDINIDVPAGVTELTV